MVAEVHIQNNKLLVLAQPHFFPSERVKAKGTNLEYLEWCQKLKGLTPHTGCQEIVTPSKNGILFYYLSVRLIQIIPDDNNVKSDHVLLPHNPLIDPSPTSLAWQAERRVSSRS